MQTPLKAIRLKCLDCSCGSANEVRECPITACPLYPYRMGHNPNIRLSEEERAKKAASVALARQSLKRNKAFSGNDPAKGKVTTPDNSGESPVTTK